MNILNCSVPAVSKLIFCQTHSLQFHVLLCLTSPVCIDGPETPSVSCSMSIVLAAAYIDLDSLPVRVLDGRVIAFDPNILHKLCRETTFPHTAWPSVSAPNFKRISCHTSSKYHDVIFKSAVLISTHIKQAAQHIAHRFDIKRDVDSTYFTSSATAQLYRSELRRVLNLKL